MNGPLLPPPHGAPNSPFSRALAWIVAWMGWALVACIGLVFIVSVLVWLAILIVVSLVSGWIRGRPSTVSLLWRQYRDLMRGRWPQRPGSKPSATPRADAVRPAANDDAVQDVHWRDVHDDHGDSSDDGKPR